jgi:hypothetical protein
MSEPASILDAFDSAEPRVRQWIWVSGHLYEEGPWDGLCGVPTYHPVGAWWWRWKGESAWRAVPGRGGEAGFMPAGDLSEVRS